MAETLGGVPRQLQIQPARPQRARLQRRSPDAGAVGRPRGHQQLVALEVARRGQALHGEVGAAARRPRRARLPRIHADRARRRRRPRASTARSPTGRCSTCSSSTCAPIAGPNTDNVAGRGRPGDRVPRARAARLAQARADRLARDLEGDRRRHAARPHRLRRSRTRRRARRRSRRATARRSAASSRSPSSSSFIKRARIRNTVWLTADVHYTAAHYYDPNKAQFQDFDPFWEFVSGPLHAGTFGPNAARQHVRAAAALRQGPAGRRGQNLPPTLGLQFFGHVAIDGRTRR